MAVTDQAQLYCLVTFESSQGEISFYYRESSRGRIYRSYLSHALGSYAAVKTWHQNTPNPFWQISLYKGKKEVPCADPLGQAQYNRNYYRSHLYLVTIPMTHGQSHLIWRKYCTLLQDCSMLQACLKPLHISLFIYN